MTPYVVNFRSHGLCDLPVEILFKIVGFLATPVYDIRPVDQKSYSDIKQLAMVNKLLRAICIDVSLHRIRVWKKDENLARTLDDIRSTLPGLLRVARSLSIRTIGPLIANDKGTRAALYSKLDTSFHLFLSQLPMLSELRLVTLDRGQMQLETFIRKFFTGRRAISPNQRGKKQVSVWPTIRVLYVRSHSSMVTIIKAFPNLKALNYSLPSKLRPRDLEKLQKYVPPSLRILAIYKLGTGWRKNQIRNIADLFPEIDSLFIEGTLEPGLQIRELADLFSRHIRLRRLVLTAQYWTPLRKHNYCALSNQQLNGFYDAWKAEAARFFTVIPNLKEFIIGRQVDLKACVFQKTEANNLPQPGEDPGFQLVGEYTDPRPAARLNMPPIGAVDSWRWDRHDGRRGWPGDDKILARPDESVDAGSMAVQRVNRGVTPAGTWGPASLWVMLNYPDMTLDHCETTFWVAEWLRLVRDPQFMKD